MNLTELAQLLEVSPTTVSRVLSGDAEKYRISRKTVQRVRDAAEEHSVSPDPLGTSLRKGKLGIVGLLLPDITNPFFAGLAREVERTLRETQITVQLCDSAEDGATEIELLRQMLARRLDGLILAPVGTVSAELLELVNSAEIPIVVLDRTMPGVASPSVSLDNFEAGRLAAQHLVEAGHEKIGCLRGDPESFTDRERYRGVVDAVEKAGLKMSPSLVAGSGYSRKSGLEGAQLILANKTLPEAVITLSGHGILGILRVASERGVRIPSDMSVVAFDEQPWSAYMNPPLDTIEQPVAEMARRAVELLEENADTETTFTFRPRLIVRESVRQR